MTPRLGRAAVWLGLLLFGAAAVVREHDAAAAPPPEGAPGLAVAVDPFLAALAPLPSVPAVPATREDVVAAEMLSHSYSLSPPQAAGAARALCQAARREGYDPLLFLAVISVESGFDHLARSQVGAAGLMQLMPTTARALAHELRMGWSATQVLDPVANVTLGVRYIASLNRRFHRHLDQALTAYNRGPGVTHHILAAHGQLPPAIRQFYAGRVLARYAAFKGRYGRLP